MIWPKYLNFPLLAFASKLLFTPACSKTHEFVLFAIHNTRIIYLSAFISNASNLSSCNLFKVQLSHLQEVTGRTSVCKSRTLVSMVMSWLFQIFLKDDTMPCLLFNLAQMSAVHSASLVITDPRYGNVSITSTVWLSIVTSQLPLTVVITFVFSALIRRSYLLLTIFRWFTSVCSSWADVAINTISSAYLKLDILLPPICNPPSNPSVVSLMTISEIILKK